MKAFLDPNQPLSTCKETNCSQCDMNGNIVCHFNIHQLLAFLLFAFPLFILGGIGIFTFSIWALMVWAAMIISYFLFIEIRVMCSHCPHYAESGTKTLKCWANYGAPKLWKYRPGPMSAGEKAIFFIGLACILLFPILLIALQNKWILGLLYLVALIYDTYLLRQMLCTKCMNFACPLNRVDKETRALFLAHNPFINDAYKQQ